MRVSLYLLRSQDFSAMYIYIEIMPTTSIQNSLLWSRLFKPESNVNFGVMPSNLRNF